jgi:biotin synthase
MIAKLADTVLAGGSLGKEEAMRLAASEGENILELFSWGVRIREKFRGEVVDLCSIVSAKTGACPEDCAYCAQSARSKAEIHVAPLLRKAEVVERARKAKKQGARRFCIVTSGRKVTPGEFGKIREMVSSVRAEGLLPCATLGLLGGDELAGLKGAGLHRYHHNLETSRRFFPEICSTHTYEEKLSTIRAAGEAGLSVCSGGIFGLGEDWEDRVDMALELRALGVDSVPVNFLVPVAGTPLGERAPLPPLEALKVVSVYRFRMPDKEIRVCGGRLQTLGEFNSMVFSAGADGLLTGDCLTVAGRDPGEDLRLIETYGLKPRPLDGDA